MAKRCEEEFNPWPPFVDVFSSVILVLLLFILIMVVNIAYYAQFKFKVSYTGTVPTSEVILSQQESVKQKLTIKEEVEEVQEKTETGDIQSAGKDLSRIYEDEVTKQGITTTEDYMIINFGDDEIILDNPTIVSVKEFIAGMKKKYPRHIVKISTVDPKNQISATVMKQISLSRTLNVRNLIRQLDYDIKDVQVDLINVNTNDIQNDNVSGFVIVRIEKK